MYVCTFVVCVCESLYRDVTDKMMITKNVYIGNITTSRTDTAQSLLIQVLKGGQLLLRSLDLSINTVSDRAGEALGIALANNSLLNTLHLDKTGLSQVCPVFLYF